MAERSGHRYDVFVSYSPADREWVEEWLLPRLEQADLQVITSDDFEGGAPRIAEIERAVRSSYRTVAILTPAWVDSEWNNFEALLVQTQDPAARQRKLVPVLLEPAGLPDRIDALVKRDLTREKQWEKQIQALIRDIVDVIPVAPPWVVKDGMRSLWQWKKWVRRYRRELWRGVALAFAVWLVVSLALQLRPFHRDTGWQALAFHGKGAWCLYRAGDVLLASSCTDFLGCDGIGLWRSTDQGETWVDVPALALQFNHPSRGRVLAAITGFAHDPSTAARHMYAATTDVGLLRSIDAGEQWTRVATDSLPAELWDVIVAPADPNLIFVAADRAGLYRSHDGGDHFHPLDGQDTCPGNAAGRDALPAPFAVGAMLATTDTIYAGTDSRSASTPSAGLYVSYDGGDCWQKADDAGGRYGYIALAAIPGASDQLLVLTCDSAHLEGEPSHDLWQFQASQGRLRKLWSTQHAAISVYVNSASPPHWYTVTDLGTVFHGPIDQAGAWKRLPTISRCILPPTCETDLAPDLDAEAPLLLANDRVYRLGTVPWYRRLWP